MATWIDSLSPELFWDVRRENLSPERHARWLVERVLEGGRWTDWRLLQAHISPAELRNILPRLRLAGREKAFLTAYLDTHV